MVALGAGAGELYKLKVGDHAISEQIVPCGQCRYCKRGQYWMCAVHDIYGFRQRTFGSWAEYMLFPDWTVICNYKVPKSIPLTSCRLHRAASLFNSRTIERGDIQLQDTDSDCTAVGRLGLECRRGEDRKVAASIIALDLSDDRIEVAKRSNPELARSCGPDKAS